MQGDHEHEEEHARPAIHELIRAFRNLRQIPWNNRRPIENCTPSETMTLFCIRRATRCNAEGLKASEISTMMNVASPTITQTLNVLTARGLLQRNPDPHDRRAVRITLTEEGERLTGLAAEAMHEKMNGLIAHLGPGRAEQLVALLDDVHAYFIGVNGDPEPGPDNWFRPGCHTNTTTKEGE
ncbi:MarR family winged helix-turn-helix transcriptional regulator [Paenibacillus sp. R14(2021)]|uniref:MarR family winged helix-turn-helix transcriptional regulator n=1 Tax=Paenibacillus sp. R14(2021) TaxID=2859228 RepID=UPI001C614F6A|nr:MarR family transcriptional regulator [Paenibacillus sp. R14(2021)]